MRCAAYDHACYPFTAHADSRLCDGLCAGAYARMAQKHMMTTTIEWTFGNFDITVALRADIGEGTASAMVLAAAGLNILQRGVASAAEKALAGYEKRPEGFQRNSLAYSEANAGKLEDAFTGKFNLNPKGKPEVWLEYTCTGVTEHEVGGTKESKFTEEKATIRKWLTLSPEEMTTKLTKIGFKGSVDGDSDEDILPACHALRAYFKSLKASL